MDDCGIETQITALFVGGTGESWLDDTRTEVTGMLAAVAGGLDERFDCRWVGYPASYGPAPHLRGMSFVESVRIGVRRLVEALAQTVGPVVLIGYSQGAVVIRTALHELWAAGDGDLSRVQAVGFVADPHQPPGVVAGCDGWGVAGAGPALPPDIPTCWVGAPDDMICNADADSLVRDIADLTSTISFANPMRWLRDCWTVLRHNSFQNATRTSLRPVQWRRDVVRLTAAWVAILCYLPRTIMLRSLAITNHRGGRHTSYQAQPYRRSSPTDPTSTGCDVVARWLQVQATFACHDEWLAA